MLGFWKRVTQAGRTVMAIGLLLSQARVTLAEAPSGPKARPLPFASIREYGSAGRELVAELVPNASLWDVVDRRPFQGLEDASDFAEASSRMRPPYAVVSRRDVGRYLEQATEAAVLRAGYFRDGSAVAAVYRWRVRVEPRGVPARTALHAELARRLEARGAQEVTVTIYDAPGTRVLTVRAFGSLVTEISCAPVDQRGVEWATLPRLE